MRHIRTRKHFRITLILLFAVTLVIFFESRVESFAPELRTIVEYKVGEAFGKNLELSIGDMSGGIFRPFMLKDVKIKGRNDSSVFSSFEIKSIRSNFRIWDVLLKDKDQRPILSFLKEVPCIYVDFVTKNRELAGYVKLEGDAKSADIQGFLIVFDKRRIEITGKLRSGSFYVELRSRSGSLKIEGKKSPDGTLLTNIRANHIKLSGVDIVCEANLKNSFIAGDPNLAGGRLEGEIETKSLVLNYSLFPDLKASYRVSNGILEVPSLALGKDMKASGWASLRDPYNMNVTFTTDNANITTILSYFGIRKSDTVTGTLNAKVDLKGPMKKLRSSAKVSLKKGTIGKVDFDSMEAVFKGEGPIVNIEESRLSRASGYISLAGEIDLRRIGKASIFQDLKLVTDDNAITWDDYQASTVQGVQKIEMTKKVSEDLTVGFKKFVPDGQVDESLRDKDQVEVEYKIQGNDSFKVMVGEDKNFVGMQHKDKF